MKILELNLERGWRGGERQTFWSALRFLEAGHDVALVARAGEPLAKAAEREGLTVHSLASSHDVWKFLKRHGHQYDILHTQTAHMLSWCVLSKFLHRRPIVATRRVAFALANRFSAFKYRHADKVVAISEACAQPLYQAGVQDVRIIRSAVWAAPPDLPRVEAFLDEQKLRGRKLLATMSALTIDKDPLTMVRAVDLLRRQRDDITFLHFGYGDMAEQVAAAVAAAGLQDHYRLVGFHQNPEDFYACLSGYVMSSREEGLGSSVLDAMLRRVPVASTDAGGLKEVLGDGRGLLSAVADAQALADNMARLIDETPSRMAERESMLDRAQVWVRQECDVQRMGERYLALFAEVLGQRP